VETQKRKSLASGADDQTNEKKKKGGLEWNLRGECDYKVQKAFGFGGIKTKKCRFKGGKFSHIPVVRGKEANCKTLGELGEY